MTKTAQRGDENTSRSSHVSFILKFTIFAQDSKIASFDTTSKKQIETNPKDFVDLCFRFEATDIKVLEIITPEQPTVEMHQADSLIKAIYNGQEVLVHIEFQTTDSYDPEMPLRMAGYIIRAIETHRLPVYSNVIYLRPDAGKNDPGKWTQQIEHHNISIEYQALRLINLDGQQVLDAMLIGLVPLTPLMGHKTGITDEQWIRRCVQIADSIDVPDKTFFFFFFFLVYLGSLAVFGSLVYESQMIMEIIMEETMQHAPIVEYLAPQAREEGKAEGIEQGKAEGKAEGIFEAILTVLEVKFESDVTEKLRPFLSTIDDLQRLDHLLLVATKTSDLDVFTQALLNLGDR